jgi:hypothetical protein
MDAKLYSLIMALGYLYAGASSYYLFLAWSTL